MDRFTAIVNVYKEYLPALSPSIVVEINMSNNNNTKSSNDNNDNSSSNNNSSNNSSNNNNQDTKLGTKQSELSGSTSLGNNNTTNNNYNYIHTISYLQYKHNNEKALEAELSIRHTVLSTTTDEHGVAKQLIQFDMITPHSPTRSEGKVSGCLCVCIVCGDSR